MGCVIPQDAQAEKGTRAWGARDRRTRTSSVQYASSEGPGTLGA